MTSAYIYGRYSSENQKDTSIDDQVRECRNYAERNGIEVIGIFADHAISGKTDNRPQFQEMLRRSASREASVILVWKLDRIGRNRTEMAINRYKLKKNGVRIVSVTENIPNTPEGIILESVLEGMAEYYSENLAVNVMRGMRGIALQCRHTGGRPLLGYKVNPDKTYSIDEQTAPTVRRIFELYADGKSYNYIIDLLNSEGKKTGSGNSFGKNSLHDLLRNERYAGTYLYNRAPRRVEGRRNAHAKKEEEDLVRIENGIPAIVDRTLWERVQKKMDANRKAPAKNKAKTEYLLSGKLFCGHCGSAMVGQSTTVRGKQYAYYDCNAQSRLRTCDKKRVRKEEIERTVVSATVNEVLKPETITFIAENIIAALQVKKEQDGTEEFQQAISEIDKQIGNIVAAISNGAVSAALTAKLNELEENKSVITNELLRERQIQRTVLNAEDVVSYIRQFVSGDPNDPEYEKKIIDVFVNSVYIYDDKTVITYNYSEKTGKDAGRRAVSNLFGFGRNRATGTIKSETFFFEEGVFGIALPVKY